VAGEEFIDLTLKAKPHYPAKIMGLGKAAPGVSPENATGFLYGSRLLSTAKNSIKTFLY
jgi:hypothetical protein